MKYTNLRRSGRGEGVAWLQEMRTIKYLVIDRCAHSGYIKKIFAWCLTILEICINYTREAGEDKSVSLITNGSKSISL